MIFDTEDEKEEILDEFKELPINKHHEYFGSKISVKLQEAP